jgi:hypothetical protein
MNLVALDQHQQGLLQFSFDLYKFPLLHLSENLRVGIYLKKIKKKKKKTPINTPSSPN